MAVVEVGRVADIPDVAEEAGGDQEPRLTLHFVRE